MDNICGLADRLTKQTGTKMKFLVSNVNYEMNGIEILCMRSHLH